jgi:hypothetical protein
MLGDCYAAAVVEWLSKNELMACDAISNVSTFSSINALLIFCILGCFLYVLKEGLRMT